MDLQQLFTIVIALAAAGYLLRRSVAAMRSSSGGCGSCSGCPSSTIEENGLSVPLRKQLYSLSKK